MSKLSKLAEIKGFKTTDEFLIEAYQHSSVSGICMNPKCDHTTWVEPDQEEGFCEKCKTLTVKSCLILGGF